MTEQAYELVPVGALEPHPDNPRRGNLELLVDSIEANGFYGVIVAQRSSGHVLAGNHRLLAARQAGLLEVPVVWLDVDDVAAKRIMLVDNRASDVAANDPESLVALLEELAEADALAGSGYGMDDLARMLAAVRPATQLTDPDEVPARPTVAPLTQPGDLWELGPHRLVCGDATSPGDVALVLEGARAAMVWTDPPYGVAYVGGTEQKLTIANDDLSATELGQLLVGAFKVIAEWLQPGGAFYICGPSGRLETTFRLALDSAGLELRQQIVWVKDRFVLGRSDYHGQHETILFGWQLGSEPEAPPLYEPDHDVMLYGWKGGAAHTFEGGRKQTTVWEHARPSASREHPTMKPVDLVKRAIANSSRVGDLVLDPFAGSGSMLIAAHHLSRRAALVELDPAYCDVICRRFQAHTGVVPIRAGVPVDFTEEA